MHPTLKSLLLAGFLLIVLLLASWSFPYLIAKDIKDRDHSDTVELMVEFVERYPGDTYVNSMIFMGLIVLSYIALATFGLIAFVAFFLFWAQLDQRERLRTLETQLHLLR